MLNNSMSFIGDADLIEELTSTIKAKELETKEDDDFYHVKYVINEKQLNDELCNNKHNLVLRMQKKRQLKFKILKIEMDSYQSKFFYQIRKSVYGEGNVFNHMTSFNLAKNFKSILRASNRILSKLDRHDLLFETFDKKFLLTFADRETFLGFKDFLAAYKDYRLKLINEEYAVKKNTKAKFYGNFLDNYNIRSRSINKKEELLLFHDPNTFILEPFNCYRLRFRWIYSLKTMIFNQSQHLVPLNPKNVVFRFQCYADGAYKMSSELLPRVNILKNKFVKHEKFNRDFYFNSEDMRLISQSKLGVINFKLEDIEKVRNRMWRDIEFLISQDAIMYNL